MKEFYLWGAGMLSNIHVIPFQVDWALEKSDILFEGNKKLTSTLHDFTSITNANVSVPVG